MKRRGERVVDEALRLIAWAPWIEDAACRGMDLQTFFLEGRSTPHVYDAARTICSRCDVLAHCREASDRAERGVPDGHLYGFVGGETPRERANRRSHSPSIPPRRGGAGFTTRHVTH